MEDKGDAYGNAMMDCLLGKARNYAIERSDGFLSIGDLGIYFTPYEEWGEIEQRMPEFVQGRVLDVGCGAGRHSLHLQGLGHEVVAIDDSPLAVEVARRRGVKNAFVASIDDLAVGKGPDLGYFDTVIMMGHNIGLLHDVPRGKVILTYFTHITTSVGRIVGTTLDVRDTTQKHHLDYQESNLRKGNLRGEITLRIRHGKFVGGWHSFLFVSEDEMRMLAEGTGWRLDRAIYGESGFEGTSYLAVLGKAMNGNSGISQARDARLKRQVTPDGRGLSDYAGPRPLTQPYRSKSPRHRPQGHFQLPARLPIPILLVRRMPASMSALA